MPHAKLLPCIACGKEFEHVMPDTYEPLDFSHLPYAGTTFYTTGHYGSTFWDSFNGEKAVVCVCDDCLRAHRDRVTYIRQDPKHPRNWQEFNPYAEGTDA